MESLTNDKLKNAGISFRKALLSDLPFLLQLRMETMEEHLANQGIHLSVEQHKERILYKLEAANVILKDGREIGFLKMIKTQEETEILQFQIEQKYQGKGIGKSILNSLIEKANQENSLLKLSVLKGNKAQFLYEKVGFVKVGEDEASFFLQKESCFFKQH